jgi:hypothetical protein
MGSKSGNMESVASSMTKIDAYTCYFGSKFHSTLSTNTDPSYSRVNECASYAGSDSYGPPDEAGQTIWAFEVHHLTFMGRKKQALISEMKKKQEGSPYPGLRVHIFDMNPQAWSLYIFRVD